MTPKEKNVIEGLKKALAILERSKKDYTYYCTKDGDLSNLGVEVFLTNSVKELSNLVGRIDRDTRKAKEETKREELKPKNKSEKKGR